MQGDMLLTDTADGGEITITNGDAKLDDALNNAAYLSAFAQVQEWWGNEYLDSPLTSNFVRFIAENSVTSQTLRRAEEKLTQDYEWMIDAGIADDVLATVSYADRRLDATVRILKNGETLQESEFAVNWENQAA